MSDDTQENNQNPPQSAPENDQINKSQLAIDLCQAFVEVSNVHANQWRALGLTGEMIAGMLTGAVVNLAGNVAISISPDFMTAAERLAIGIMQFVRNHYEQKEVWNAPPH